MTRLCGLLLLFLTFVLLAHPPSARAAVLFQESFEDAAFVSRGWYDGSGSGGSVSTAEHIAGSARSFQCTFEQGATGCSGGSPLRHLFTDTGAVYVSFWVKHSANWRGSGRPYHPHLFHILTSQNDAYSGLSWNRLTAYLEQNEGIPTVLIQDGQNVDTSRIGQNLTAVTERRAVAGCNGDSDGHGNGQCYACGSGYCNGKAWRADGVYFSDAAGPRYKGDWHRVEVYLQLNSVANGVAWADGVVRYWFDGQLLIDHANVVLRTGSHPTMKFNQLVLAPYIGDGSPVTQTLWLDDLTVATERPAASGDNVPPSPPTGLRIVE
jgi:hypothetical protein